MAWSASITHYVRASNPVTVATGGSESDEISYGQSPESLANGTGAAQIDLGFFDSRTYSTGGTTLDLTNLAAASSNLGAATFSAVKYLLVKNADATNDLVVGNGTTPFNPGLSAANTTMTVQEGGQFIFYNPTAAGWTTTSATDLKIASSASTPTGVVIILGED